MRTVKGKKYIKQTNFVTIRKQDLPFDSDYGKVSKYKHCNSCINPMCCPFNMLVTSDNLNNRHLEL